MSLQLNGVRKFGRGVAIAVAAPELQALQSALSAAVEEYLTPQIDSPIGHVAVQNKVDPKIADYLYAA